MARATPAKQKTDVGNGSVWARSAGRIGRQHALFDDGRWGRIVRVQTGVRPAVCGGQDDCRPAGDVQLSGALLDVGQGCQGRRSDGDVRVSICLRVSPESPSKVLADTMYPRKNHASDCEDDYRGGPGDCPGVTFWRTSAPGSPCSRCPPASDGRLLRSSGLCRS